MKRLIFIIAIYVLVFSFFALPETWADTLTYNNAGGNNDWANPANWQTGVVGTTTDDVLVTANVRTISSGVASVNSAVFSGGATWNAPVSWPYLILSVATNATFNASKNRGSIVGDAIFNNGSQNYGPITGNAFFNSGSYNKLGGDISGDATFNTTWYGGPAPTGGVFIFTLNSWQATVGGTVRGADNNPITRYEFYNSTGNLNGTLTGNVVFNDNSCNAWATINGDVIFNDASYNDNGTINGDAIFDTTWYSGTSPSGGLMIINGSRYWGGEINGAVRGADGNPIERYECYDNAYFYWGTTTGDVVFNGSSYNYGSIIIGNTTFNDSSYNSSYGVLAGDVTFNTTGSIAGTLNGGVISGDFRTTGITINSGTVESRISGTGALVKAGTGILIVNGVNTYSGGTTISAGTLVIGSGGSLGSGAVANNAALDIGANTLNIPGIYTQANNSTLCVTVDSPSTSGKISSNANAVVSAASSIDVTIAGNIFIPHNASFTIIDVPGGPGVNVPGTITSSSPRLEFSGSIVNGDLVLTSDRSARGFAGVAVNPNAVVVGHTLDNVSVPTSDMTTVLNTLEGLSDADTASALDTMAPPVDSGVLDNSAAALDNFTGVSLERAQSVLQSAAQSDAGNTGISSGDEGATGGIWVKEYGSYLSQGARKGLQGYDAWNTGTAVGVDRMLGDAFTLGVSGGYGFGKVNTDANEARTDITSGQGALYAGYQDANIPYFIEAAGSFSWNWYEGTRDIRVGAIERRADADYEGRQYGVYVNGGYHFRLAGSIEFTPVASLQWSCLQLAGYTETNAGSMNLNVDPQSYDMLQSGLGARIASSVKYPWGVFTPEITVQWLYDFIGDDVAVAAAYTGGGGAFTVAGAQPAKNSMHIGGKVSFDLKDDISIIGECDTRLRDKFLGIYGSATVRYEF